MANFSFNMTINLSQFFKTKPKYAEKNFGTNIKYI